MKNYYDQLNELKVAQNRLKSLNEKKRLYFEMTQPKSVIFSFDKRSTNLKGNSLEDYVCRIEKIDNEIKMINEEITILNEYLKNMEHHLRNMNGSLEKIFVLRYIDGLSVKRICRRLHYSRAQVYRKLSVIRKVLKDETK